MEQCFGSLGILKRRLGEEEGFSDTTYWDALAVSSALSSAIVVVSFVNKLFCLTCLKVFLGTSIIFLKYFRKINDPKHGMRFSCPAEAVRGL